ncbi:MAG: hypothetical protein AAF664_16050, partial [Planctomycetota bacterium]
MKQNYLHVIGVLLTISGMAFFCVHLIARRGNQRDMDTLTAKLESLESQFSASSKGDLTVTEVEYLKNELDDLDRALLSVKQSRESRFALK